MVQDNRQLKREYRHISPLNGDDSWFIEEIARQKACDVTFAQEKISQMVQLCPPARKTSVENLYAWIEENWNNYQLVSF